MSAPRRSGTLKHLAVVKDRSVLALLSARSFSLVGNAMAPVALAFAVLQMPGGSATTLGLVLTARTAAQVFFVLFGGVLADRLPRNKVMVGADLAAGLTQTAVGILIISRVATPGMLAGLSIANGAAAALFEPASRSLMPKLVTGKVLQSANALLQLSIRAGSILGSALAGLLVAVVGPGQTLLVDAATFFVSAALLAGIRVTQAESGAGGPTLVSQLRDGWREFASRRWVLATVLQLGFVNVCLAGSFYVLGPVVAHDHLGGAAAWAAILTAQAIGFVSGSALAIKLRPSRPVRTAALTMSGFALPLFFLASFGPLAAIAAASFLAAICIDIYQVLLDTAMQKFVPEQSLSRVMSYETVASFALVPLGLAVTGPIAAAIGVRQTLLGAGVLIVLAGPVVTLLPSVRGIRDEPQRRHAEDGVSAATELTVLSTATSGLPADRDPPPVIEQP